MKKYVLLFLLASSFGKAQLTMDSLKKIVQPLYLGYSTYFSDFAGKQGYGGPYILTKDGGAAAFGDNVLHKFDKTGKQIWKKAIKDRYQEMETQVCAEDGKGNLYCFMLEYNHAVYRGGNERLVCYDKTGKLLWDKTIGKAAALNNPIVSYVKTDADGKIYMRGHVAFEKKENGDPKYLFWEGWIDPLGKLTQKTGEELDWSKPDTMKKFKPE
jgi:outer membrane protein assembly factor BamB